MIRFQGENLKYLSKVSVPDRMIRREVSLVVSKCNAIRKDDIATAVAVAMGVTAAAIAIVMTAAVYAHGATGGDPMSMVKSTVSQVIGVLNDKQTPQAERRQRLVQLVAGHFDFSDMARDTLGVHWAQLSPEQRQQFVPLFTSFMEDAYLGKIESYSGQPIEFIRENSNGPNDAEVSSKVKQDDQEIRIDYRLKQEGGEWKVYDVTVDDISITANYRNQFNRVINNQGYDALVNAMRTKERELNQSLAS